MDFNQCINKCALSEVKSSGSKFTWWNGRIDGECIFKKLDRVLCNQEFEQILPTSKVHHLIRQGSDHAPLHFICNSEESIIRPFKFLNFWTKHPKFRKVAHRFWNFKQRSRRCSWSKETFGNIFNEVQTLEEEIRIKEMQLEINPSPGNRQELSRT
ncbi:hypothetical protein H5410_054072 [Solanum commersonii]|uniref:Uncharacterized protein n=1 Tax=Solanum commersonii TaxID=4109 RepID=A0A9J5X7K6_SOLCO|nr:hypothetical protein H5410_054072 [Solanum commersonii]